MTYNQVLSRLKQKEWARERKNRHTFIMDMLEENYMNVTVSNRERIRDFILDYNNIVRLIQMVQKDNEDTRGIDYENGKVLSQEKVLSLGYEVGFRNDIKTNKLF